MQNTLLYAATVLIWGSTWYVIKFQLGVVDPLFSLGYRFGLAALMLLAFCYARKLLGTARISRQQHMFIALQGVFLFCLSYILSYTGVSLITTGFVAVCFSTITLMNAFNQRIFLRIPLDKKVLLASALGLIGIAFVFWPEISHFHWGDKIVKGVAICLAAAYVASLGNIVSFRNNRAGIPVIVTNMYGMMYGAAGCFILAFAKGAPIAFDVSAPYIISLIYLSLFGSVIAFGCYFKLMQKIGADRAAYSAVLFPVVALAISTVYENYHWTMESIIGVALILGGNVIAMRKKKSLKENLS